jgi:hypothetical protein
LKGDRPEEAEQWQDPHDSLRWAELHHGHVCNAAHPGMYGSSVHSHAVCVFNVLLISVMDCACLLSFSLAQLIDNDDLRANSIIALQTYSLNNMGGKKVRRVCFAQHIYIISAQTSLSRENFCSSSVSVIIEECPSSFFLVPLFYDDSIPRTTRTEWLELEFWWRQK